MHNPSNRTVKTIRMSEDIYHQARVASVMSRKGLGHWLEEAIIEKLNREPARMGQLEQRGVAGG